MYGGNTFFSGTGSCQKLPSFTSVVNKKRRKETSPQKLSTTFD